MVIKKIIRSSKKDSKVSVSRKVSDVSKNNSQKRSKSGRRKKVSLVLGGGGARGFFHIGVLKALRDLGVEIEEISGASIGALIGAVYAQNPDHDLDSLVDDVGFMSVSKIVKGEGLVGHKKIYAEVQKLITAKRFSSLKIPLKFVTNDINTGEEFIFEKGNIYPGLFASFAIPGVFPLVEWKKHILCDGGLTNNIPVDVIEGKKVVISDISIPLEKISLKSSKVNILKNSFLIPRRYLLDFRNSIALKNKRSVVLEFHKHHNIFDFRKEKLESMIQIGYDETMKKKDEILGL